MSLLGNTVVQYAILNAGTQQKIWSMLREIGGAVSGLATGPMGSLVSMAWYQQLAMSSCDPGHREAIGVYSSASSIIWLWNQIIKVVCRKCDTKKITSGE